jgi:hypothetical protein
VESVSSCAPKHPFSTPSLFMRFDINQSMANIPNVSKPPTIYGEALAGKKHGRA